MSGPKERDLRLEVKRQLKDRVAFVEHGTGGTTGFSDAIVFYEAPDQRGGSPNLVVFLELKRTTETKLRPTQIEFARKVILNGCYYLICSWEEDLTTWKEVYHPFVEVCGLYAGKLVTVQKWNCNGNIMNSIISCIEHFKTLRKRHRDSNHAPIREGDIVRYLQ